MAYSELLKDPRWQKKRLQILQRDNWACKYCGDTSSTLHVHHESYESDKPWETADYFLITLCEDCHELVHTAKTNLEKFLLDSLLSRLISEGRDIKRFAKFVKHLDSL